uniref:ATP synthase F0 subunit 8 n=1 Tax=Dermacentor steini TaxID=859978 RepID=A0A976MYR1_9ACAR|nr:ATP synthase F0 subunit 8 [Dermacentor steini]
MPQIFPMNWLLISMMMMMSLFFMMIFMYFNKFKYISITPNLSKKNFFFNYQW